ncbi:MAG: DegT/DnrJ/EryC1/StrS family aminotransferase [Bacteroidetes bacterium]|nr:DegT/DnrJ/EryC1/StrS family aminotransferase [Bacteroidota bacterium]
MKIQMVDLHGQYLKIKKDVDQAIQGVIDSTAFINGGEVKEFAQELAEYLNVKHVIPCANGTDALQVAFMALGLKPGDEVIVPVFTYVATAEVIALLGLKPVMVDVHPDTFNIDVDQARSKITANTKAIVPVHLFGQCADMDAVMELANEFNLFVVEDTAQAIGSVYTSKDGSTTSAGCIGHFGTTSFFPSKNLGCFGDGGAIFTNDSDLAEQARVICNHGQRIKYHHSIIGVNSRLDTLQAAILRVKLRHLDSYCAARQELAAFYDEALKNDDRFATPVRSAQSTHVFHQYTMKLREDINRAELQEYLRQHGVPSMVYYPVPLNEQEAFASDGNYPVSKNLCERVLSIPMSTEVTPEQRNYIVETLTNFIQS